MTAVKCTRCGSSLVPCDCVDLALDRFFADGLQPKTVKMIKVTDIPVTAIKAARDCMNHLLPEDLQEPQLTNITKPDINNLRKRMEFVDIIDAWLKEAG